MNVAGAQGSCGSLVQFIWTDTTDLGRNEQHVHVDRRVALSPSFCRSLALRYTGLVSRQCTTFPLHARKQLPAVYVLAQGMAKPVDAVGTRGNMGLGFQDAPPPDRGGRRGWGGGADRASDRDRDRDRGRSDRYDRDRERDRDKDRGKDRDGDRGRGSTRRRSRSGSRSR